jgi:hypothetical protein
MRKALIVMALTAVSTAAMARDLTLNGEYGCEDQATQRSRLVLMQNIVSDLPHYVAQRAEMQESLVNLSTYMCRPLTGAFKVLRRDGAYTQVQAQPVALWVTE